MKYEVLSNWESYTNFSGKDEIWFDRTYLAVSMTVALVLGLTMGMLLTLLVIL